MSDIVPAGNEKLGTTAQPFDEINGTAIHEAGQRVATLDSPTFVGNPTAPDVGGSIDSSQALAVTAFVQRVATAAVQSAIVRGNHTGTQSMATISDAGALATLDTVSTAQIDDNAVTGNELSDTGVTAGPYTNVNITVDAQGRITSITNGSAGGSYNDEAARDAIAAALTDTDSITFSYDDDADEITATIRVQTLALTGGSQQELGVGTDGVYGKLGTTDTTAAAGDDARFPSTEQKEALVGTGTAEPSDTNRFVTDDDARLQSATLPVPDTTALVVDPSDENKSVGINAGSVTARRNIIMPDVDVTLVADNRVATADPTTNDTAGYSVGSRWTNLSTGEIFELVDVVNGTWVSLTSSGGGGGTNLPVDEATALVKNTTATKKAGINTYFVKSNTTSQIYAPPVSARIANVWSKTFAEDDESLAENTPIFWMHLPSDVFIQEVYISIAEASSNVNPQIRINRVDANETLLAVVADNDADAGLYYSQTLPAADAEWSKNERITVEVLDDGSGSAGQAFKGLVVNLIGSLSYP